MDAWASRPERQAQEKGCNPDLAAKHRRLVADGKPGKVALVAVMRKLLLLANVLLRDDRLWTPRAGDRHKTPLPEAAEDAASPRRLRQPPAERWHRPSASNSSLNSTKAEQLQA